MEKDLNPNQSEEILENEEELLSRRDFLRSLKKWSKVVIGAALVGSTLAGTEDEANAGAWVNRYRGGGGWVNRYGGGGGWVNRAGGGWVNRRGVGGAGWINRW